MHDGREARCAESVDALDLAQMAEDERLVPEAVALFQKKETVLAQQVGGFDPTVLSLCCTCPGKQWPNRRRRNSVCYIARSDTLERHPSSTLAYLLAVWVQPEWSTCGLWHACDPLQKLVIFTQLADYCTSSGRPQPPRKIKRAAPTPASVRASSVCSPRRTATEPPDHQHGDFPGCGPLSRRAQDRRRVQGNGERRQERPARARQGDGAG